jgi:hypothetical protein
MKDGERTKRTKRARRTTRTREIIPYIKQNLE